MFLKELIEELERQDPKTRLAVGFHKPHSYRGYYEDLAFEPTENITIGEMLEAAMSALGNTYFGWKGGEYRMDERTECWIAERGNTGETLGKYTLLYMYSTELSPEIVAWPPESDKDPAMQKVISNVMGHEHNIYNTADCSTCIARDLKPEDFRDDLSRKEFAISRMCQACQDKVFG